MVGKGRPGCLQEASGVPPPRVQPPPGQRFYASSLLTECGEASAQSRYGVRWRNSPGRGSRATVPTPLSPCFSDQTDQPLAVCLSWPEFCTSYTHNLIKQRWRPGWQISRKRSSEEGNLYVGLQIGQDLVKQHTLLLILIINEKLWWLILVIWSCLSFGPLPLCCLLV